MSEQLSFELYLVLFPKHAHNEKDVIYSKISIQYCLAQLRFFFPPAYAASTPIYL